MSGIISPPDFNLSGEPLPDSTLSETDLFIVHPMNQWIKEAHATKIPAKLFGDFWFEGEMVILFASSGVGKSLLAYQIADAITTNKKTLIFDPSGIMQKLVYCDFEMSSKQIESRYSNNYSNHFVFSPFFYRVEINPDSNSFNSSKFEDSIIAALEQTLLNTEARILIVDNITFFKDEQEKAKDALKLMKQLKNLKKRLGLSILVLAHSPKRDISKPISRNDISGSSMIVNFTDSAFCIGESAKAVDVRYLKQIKSGRFAATVYDSTNVIVCKITNPDNFTLFEFCDFGDENDHLKIKEDKKDRDETIMKFHKSGLSLRAIAEHVGISHAQVSKVIKANTPAITIGKNVDNTTQQSVDNK